MSIVTVTNLRLDDLPKEGTQHGALRLHCGDAAVSLHDFYAAVAKNEPLALAGSHGFLELAVNGGHFAQLFDVQRGARVEATW